MPSRSARTPPTRILTTHVGSLPRPPDLVDMIVAQDRGAAPDAAKLARRVRRAVAETVKRQIAAGIDVVNDGEMGKISYVNYLKHRLAGFGAPAPLNWRVADLADHPESSANAKGALAKHIDPPACRSPIAVKDTKPLEHDLKNLADALKNQPSRGFMSAASPGVVAIFMPNRFYKTEDAYVAALADALQDEYERIHRAGFTVQIDCPDLAMSRHMAYVDLSLKQFRKIAERNVAALNHATRNIPREALRMHVCWGNYPGPHTHDVPFKDVADIVFKARPQSVLFEAANPRHGHEWEELASVKIPDDAMLVPGVIDTNTNTVEHPTLVAQRIENYARIVGRERVMAATDCGFATLASLPRVWPSVVWEKLRALSEGAKLASERLWKRQ